jgi:heptosyltransferase I
VTPPTGLLARTDGRLPVAVVLLTGIGDLVHGLPLACDLKRSAPDRSVIWIAEPAPAEVLRHHPAVDRVVVFRKRAGLKGVRELFAAFRGSPCGLTLNLMRYFKGVFPVLATRAPVRLGLPPSKTRDGVRLFNTHHLAETPWRHTQDLFLGFREPLGVSADAPVEWRITFSPEERADQARFFAPLREAGQPIVGLVLASANVAKDWPATRYAELAVGLERDLGARALLVGGPSDEEAHAGARVHRAAPEVLSGLSDSVRRMMWMVDGVDVLVSPDTGPLHIAHALGTPVVGLFGHTNPWRVGPWRDYQDLLIDRYTEPGEAPDPARYQPRHGRMERIGVAEVMEAVSRALELVR